MMIFKKCTSAIKVEVLNMLFLTSSNYTQICNSTMNTTQILYQQRHLSLNVRLYYVYEWKFNYTYHHHLCRNLNRV